jgi:ribosomal RNA-processing protein 17
MREERKADLEKHVEAINTLLRKAAAGNMSSDSGDDDDEDGWSGIKDAKAAPLDIEAEFEDEDRHTTVTIEAVDITKDGFKKPTEDDGEEDAVVHVAPEEAEKPQAEKRDENGKRIWTKERPNFPKKKKKKFRYESKAERKVTRYKERSKGRSQAKERKE